MNKTCRTVLEKQRLNPNWHFPTDAFTWMCQCWPTNKNLEHLCTDTKCSLVDLLWVMDERNEWWETVWDICTSSMTWWWQCIWTSYEHVNSQNVYQCKCSIIYTEKFLGFYFQLSYSYNHKWINLLYLQEETNVRWKKSLFLKNYQTI